MAVVVVEAVVMVVDGGVVALVGVGVVCRDVVPALVSEEPVTEGPAVVSMEGVLVVPGFPAGEGALDAVCTGLVAVPVLFWMPWNINNMATVNILSPV